MAKFFGKTWWGEEWLKALSNIDNANRIPRGSAYAKAGKVKKMEISGNKISATVQGSWNYFVKIEIPKFDESRFEDFISRLKEKPVIISKLLNRELDPEILTIAQKSGLKVFPKKWSDLAMECDCSDYAVPCKHLAAVIYTISREIDNNPFLVFSIHGIDLIEELQKRGLTIQTSDITEVENISILLEKEKNEIKIQEFRRPDFSIINDNLRAICNILPKETPFYPNANFLTKYNSEISKIAKTATKILEKKSDFFLTPYTENKTKKINHNTDLQIFIESDLSFSISELETQTLWNLDEILPEVFYIPQDYLEDFSPSITALNQALICTLYLLAGGNFAPKVFVTPQKTFSIKWFATKIDSAVEKVLEDLENIIPPNFISAKLPGARKYFPIKRRAELIVSLILDFLIKNISNPDKNDEILEFIFALKPQKFSNVGETEIPGSIKAWTNRLFFNSHEYGYQIITSEKNNEVFSLEIAVEIKKEPIMLTNILREEKYGTVKFKILKEISLISSFITGFEDYINQDASEPIIYDLAKISEFLLSIAPSLRLLGVKIMLPKSLQQILRPRVSMKIVGKSSNSKSYIRLDELLDFNWQVALGDNLISYDEFLKLYKTAAGLIKIKQNYFYINESDIERIKKVMETPAKLSSVQVLQTALSETFDSTPIKFDKTAQDLLKKLKNQAQTPVPKNIKAVLRPYQKRGFDWLCRNHELGFGSILADDMGLGKTLQTIVFLQKLKNDKILDKKKVLVVVPTGLISNWQNEMRKFAPELTFFTYHGTNRNIKSFSSDVLLTTYGIMRSDLDKLKKQKWAVMIIDEAQNIKNQTTAQTKAAFSIQADSHVALSGTPVENRLSEFWSIMNFVNTGYFGSIKKFSQQYANPIQNLGDKNCAERLKRAASPFMMRRLKTDKTIICDLPDKIEQNEFAQLTASQAAIYDKTLEEAMKAIKEIQQTDSQSLFKRQGLILQMILALKQICNHPALFLKNQDFKPELSGKSEIFLSLIETIIENGQKALVFTQFKEMGDILSEMIYSATGQKPLFLHGGCTIEQRKNMVEKFQTQKQHQIFILSLKAAGTGLNLTAANHVIHYDLWWNPAVEAQATDRAYRIGQHQNVVVHRFITQNTFEEKIDKMIQDKKQLADLTVATGEGWLGKLSNKELEELF